MQGFYSKFAQFISYEFLNSCLAMWQVLCTFKALKAIVRRKAENDSRNDDEADQLITLEEFYNLYEALDFKWIPPVRKNCLLVI